MLMTSANKCLEEKFSPRVTVLRYFALKNLGILQQKNKLNIATSKPADEEDLLNYCLGLEFLTPEKSPKKKKNENKQATLSESEMKISLQKDTLEEPNK